MSTYPFDLPGMLSRRLPSLKIPLKLANCTTGRRDKTELVDCDESGLIAIHKGIPPAEGFTIVHPPTGVAYLQDLTLNEALDLSQWLVAHLDRIKRLKLDYTKFPDASHPDQCQITEDPGNVIGVIQEWQRRNFGRGGRI